LNTAHTSACKQEKESETVRNLLGVRVEMSWRASKLTKHLAVNEEAVGRRLLENKIYYLIYIFYNSLIIIL